MITYQIKAESDMHLVAPSILEKMDNNKICLLIGDLGAGKTTLVKAIFRELKSTLEVTSPTYSLINEYQHPGGLAYHMDLYRLNSLEEALDIGIEEYLNSGNYCFIEWPEVIFPLLEDNFIKLSFEILENETRTVNLSIGNLHKQSDL